MLKLKGIHDIVITTAVVLLCPVIKLFLLFPLVVREHRALTLQVDIGIHNIHAAGRGSDSAVVRCCGCHHIHHLEDYREGISNQFRIVILHEHCGRIPGHILGHGVHSHLLD